MRHIRLAHPQTFLFLRYHPAGAARERKDVYVAKWMDLLFRASFMLGIRPKGGKHPISLAGDMRGIYGQSPTVGLGRWSPLAVRIGLWAEPTRGPCAEQTNLWSDTRPAHLLVNHEMVTSARPRVWCFGVSLPCVSVFPWDPWGISSCALRG